MPFLWNGEVVVRTCVKAGRAQHTSQHACGADDACWTTLMSATADRRPSRTTSPPTQKQTATSSNFIVGHAHALPNQSAPHSAEAGAMNGAGILLTTIRNTFASIRTPTQDRQRENEEEGPPPRVEPARAEPAAAAGAAASPVEATPVAVQKAPAKTVANRKQAVAQPQQKKPAQQAKTSQKNRGKDSYNIEAILDHKVEKGEDRILVSFQKKKSLGAT